MPEPTFNEITVTNETDNYHWNAVNPRGGAEIRSPESLCNYFIR
jgi:hypothetical protein